MIVLQSSFLNHSKLCDEEQRKQHQRRKILPALYESLSTVNSPRDPVSTFAFSGLAGLSTPDLK